MADWANSSSKLSVASRANQCHGNSCWPIGIGFALSALSFSFIGFCNSGSDLIFYVHSSGKSASQLGEFINNF